tara:strand:- start:493 stop:906 length:414 start_codon:yes stop_codon:yes gene_type:complete
MSDSFYPVVAGGYLDDQSKHWPRAVDGLGSSLNMSEVVLHVGGESFTAGRCIDHAVECGSVEGFDYRRISDTSEGPGILRDAWMRAVSARMLFDFPYVDDVEFCRSVVCFNAPAIDRFMMEYGRQLLTISIMRGGDA